MTRSYLLSAAALAVWAASPAQAQDAPGGAGTKTPPPVTGEQVYKQVCQGCHMADGKGDTGAATIASLAANPKLKFAAYPITIVAKGKGAMPWLTDLLSNEQIAAVVGYVRTHFGNNYADPVTAEQVGKLAGPPPKSTH
jgi:mono/diheme cytochrome c family protein